MRLRLPKLDGPAKAQLWGLAFSFAIALHFANQMGLSLAIYIIGVAASWAAWEAFASRRIVTTVQIGLLSGLAIPWGGFLLAYGLEALRP
ncbi:MAG: hypothetical protein AB7P07_10120 [Hyphomonadaceae bacterium]